MVPLRRLQPAPDRGDVVMGWLTKLVVVLSLSGVVGFDLVSVGAARLAVQDHADDAARAGSVAYLSSSDVQTAYSSALESATTASVDNAVDAGSFSVARDGTTHLTLHRTAPTLVLRMVPPLRGWARVTAAGTGTAAL